MPTPAPAVYPATIRIGILAYENFEPLDVWGFCEPFSVARFLGTGYRESDNLPFELLLIANQDGNAGKGAVGPRPVKSYNGPRVAPDLFRNQALRARLDVLMVPGGFGTGAALDDPKLIEWLRRMDQRVALMTSVCTGAALFAKAGLLDGKAAATNHQAFGWVAQQGPLVLWDNCARWVDAGRYVTSAGVSAGIDMGFYLVQRLLGRAAAEVAAITAEYDWHRDPRQPIEYPPQASIPVPLT